MKLDEIQRRSRELFRIEAGDLLTELEGALLELEQDPSAAAAINRVFRAMHTLKGSGATSGFTALSGFLHHVEEVFNAARENRIAVTTEIVDRTLRLCDAIKRYLDAEPDAADAVLAAAQGDLDGLLRFLPTRAAAAAAPAAAPAPGARSARNAFRIRFKPAGGVFRQGIDPGMFLDGVRALGACTVRAVADDLPPFEGFDPEECALAWEIELRGAATETAVRDVFLFVEDACELTVAALPPVRWIVEYTVTPRLLESPGAAGGIRKELESLGPVTVAAAPEGGDAAAGLWRLVVETTEPAERIEDAFAFAIDAGPKVTREATAPGATAGVPGPATKPAAARAAAKKEMLRVSAERLDRLVNLVGELVILRSQVSEACGQLPAVPPMLQSAQEGLQRLAFELRDVVLGVRMMPVGETFSKFRRLTRDLSRDLGKEVALAIEGAETEMDKTVLDQLADPLMHLVRNSLDHGFELPDERERAGKPRGGTLTLRAEQRGDRVLVVVADDGRGLDAGRILAKAVARGLVSPEATPTTAEIHQFIFLPGFSTAETVSQVSGRGVGLDVVKKSVEALRGNVELRSEPGKGTEIRLSLPLTLAIIEGLMVRVAEDRYVLPLGCARETIELPRDRRIAANGRNIVALRGEMVPYLRLREIFEYTGQCPPIERIVVVEIDDKRVGIAVDEVLGNHQTVLKSLGWIGHRVNVFTGATVLGDGRVAMIIDVPGLVAYDANRVPPAAAPALQFAQS